MVTPRRRSLGLPGILCAAGVACSATAAHADIHIAYTGMNLVYDGSAFYDAASSVGGVANPADADALASVDFFNNGVLVGSLTSDVYVDFYIPDIVGIPAAANTMFNLVTPGNPGFFDLLIGSSPLASEFLILDIESVSITYVDVAGLAQFTFGAAISTQSAQNLPFGLTMDDPMRISFSARLDMGTRTTAGGFVTGFEASGTGEFGEIPAPGAAALLVIGAGVVPVRRRCVR